MSASIDGLPPWLNPWWHDRYEVTIPIEARHIWSRFQADGRIEAKAAAGGRDLILTRRHRYLGGYVRTVAELTTDQSGTRVVVTFRRPLATAWLMVGFAALGLLLPIAEALLSVMAHGWSAIWTSNSPFLLVSPISVVIVFTENHWSTRSDTRELKAIVAATLTQPPLWLWRKLANV
jgi:hypothetical protein